MRPAQDLLHVLARDHRRLDERCRSLLADPARRTEQTVLGLATDVLVHEASEQLLLHPIVTDRLEGGVRLARQRTDEEAALERRLQAALREGPDTPAFTERFGAFHRALVEHADREELEVFPALRHVVNRRQLRELGRAYSTLAVRLPTRLRCASGGIAALGGTDRRPLDCIRETAEEILAELGDAAPTGTASAPHRRSVGDGVKLAGSA
jgi:hemerythrin superfamily protein